MHRSAYEQMQLCVAAYTGVDVRPGANVDRVMTAPYRVPVKSSSADVVLSGQAFEHIPFFWASMLEIARVLKPGGLAFVTAPRAATPTTPRTAGGTTPTASARWPPTASTDLREAYTDFPPAEGIRHAYRAIDAKHAYWGDSVGVFQKPRNQPRLTMALVRATTLWWANRVGGVDSVPLPAPLPGREHCGLPAPSVPVPAPATEPDPDRTRQGAPGHARA